MTTDFTSTITSNKKTAALSDNLSSAFKTEFQKAGGSAAFDSLLSNASKSYADIGAKTSSNNFNSKDYAKSTKSVKDNVSSHTDAAKNTNAFAEKKDSITADKKTQNKNKSQKPENHTVDKTDAKHQNDGIKNADDEKKIADAKEPNSIEKNIQDPTKNTEAQQTAAQDSAKQTENLQETEPKEVSKDETKQNETIEKAEQTVSKNTLENEKIIANIEYTGEAVPEAVEENTIPAEPAQSGNPSAETETASDADTKAQAPVEAKGEKMNEIEQEIVDRVIQNYKNGTNTANAGVSTSSGAVLESLPADEALKEIMKAQETAKQGAVIDTAASNAEIEIDVDADTAQTQKLDTNTNTVPKTAKENLDADTSRLTVNIEKAPQEKSDDTAVLTPTSKTETSAKSSVEEPVIKVSSEAAAQAKQTVEVPSNKDFTSSVKDKAAAQMTDLQGTNTVVTEVQNSSQNQTNSNTNSNTRQNNSSMQGSAAEQVVKLSIDNSSTSNISGAESFLNKLDSASGSAAKTAPQNTLLNKSDIMSQVNAKFNEMQLGVQNKVSIILQPENLGKVSLEIMSSKDGIVAKMTTENQQVKELFDKNVEALKTSLSSQGVNVNNIKIECTNETANNSMNFERDQFTQSNFSDSNGHNHQTSNSEQNAQSAYSNEYGTNEEAAAEISSTAEIKNTDSKIKHNGKVDYTV